MASIEPPCASPGAPPHSEAAASASECDAGAAQKPTSASATACTQPPQVEPWLLRLCGTLAAAFDACTREHSGGHEWQLRRYALSHTGRNVAVFSRTAALRSVHPSAGGSLPLHAAATATDDSPAGVTFGDTVVTAVSPPAPPDSESVSSPPPPLSSPTPSPIHRHTSHDTTGVSAALDSALSAVAPPTASDDGAPPSAAAAAASGTAGAATAPLGAVPPVPKGRRKVWSSVALETGGSCFVGCQAGAVHRGVAAFAVRQWRPRLHAVTRLRRASFAASATGDTDGDVPADATPPGDDVAGTPGACNWTQASEAMALDAVTRASGDVTQGHTVWPWSVAEVTATAVYVVDVDAVHAVTRGPDAVHVRVLHHMPTLAFVTTAGGCEKMYPLATVAPMVPHWHVARCAFAAQSMATAYAAYRQTLPSGTRFGDAVHTRTPPAHSASAPDACSPDVATFTPSGLPFQSRRHDVDVVQVVPGWGRFAHNATTRQTRAVFQDRTIVVVHGQNIDMLLPDGSAVAGTITFLRSEPTLMPYLEAAVEFDVWAREGRRLPEVPPPPPVLPLTPLLKEVNAMLADTAGTLAVLEAHRGVAL